MITKLASTLVRRARAIVVVAAIAAAGGTMASGVGKQVERGVDQMRARMLPTKPSGRVVVVAIDQESISRIHAWPWPRSTHARLLDKLRAYGATDVAFDVDFSSPASDTSQDKAMVAALTRWNGRVRLIGSADQVDGHPVKMEPIPSYRSHSRTVGSWVQLDQATGEITVPYTQTFDSGAKPTMAVVLAGRQAPAGGSMPIDWSMSYRDVPTYSYADVLEGRLPLSALRGRKVIVGATADTMGDRWSTPNDYRMPGVFLHALGAETLMHGLPVDLGPLPALVALIALIAASTTARNRTVASCGIAVAAAMVVAASWLLRHEASVILRIAPGLAGVIAAMAANAGIGLAQMVISSLTTDNVTDLPNLTAMRIDAPTGGATVAVRLRNYLETTAALGPEMQADLLRRVRDRIRVAAGDQAVYQVDDHSFAWRTPLGGQDLTETAEGLVGLFVGGIQLAGKVIDAPVSIGIFDGEATAQTDVAVTSALLAADHAAREGLPWTRHQERGDDAEWRVTMMSELDRALNGVEEAGRIWVAYQPKLDVRSHRIAGAEALVRWTHPTRGPIRPDTFIPALEDAGRIEPLTLHVLETAIRDFSAMPALHVAVNLSTRLLGGDHELPERIKGMLAAHGMEPDRLTLEVTESAAMKGAEAIDELETLRDMGVGISIDDYGTGQSTLTYIKKLPADELKIDQSFVRSVVTSRSDQAMISSTIALAHELGMKVVAEGVETADVLETLKSLDCDVIQGYHIGKPVALDEFVGSVARDIVNAKREAA